MEHFVDRRGNRANVLRRIGHDAESAGAVFGKVSAMAHSPQGGLFLAGISVTPITMLVALIVSGMVGLISAMIPSYHAAKVDIVEGLRYIG